MGMHLGCRAMVDLLATHDELRKLIDPSNSQVEVLSQKVAQLAEIDGKIVAFREKKEKLITKLELLACK